MGKVKDSKIDLDPGWDEYFVTYEPPSSNGSMIELLDGCEVNWKRISKPTTITPGKKECDCGTWTTYGKDVCNDMHSDWCKNERKDMSCIYCEHCIEPEYVWYCPQKNEIKVYSTFVHRECMSLLGLISSLDLDIVEETCLGVL